MPRKVWQGGFRAQMRVEPEGRVRQSQAVTTYGPGAMIDLVEDAVVVGGLDFWRFNNANSAISEARLRDVLAPELDKTGRKLRLENSFLLPPAGSEREPSRNCGIEVLEFPRWFVCQNPECRALQKNTQLVRKAGKYWHTCVSRKTASCVPVRFVMACRRGHLEDFQWVRFIHDLNGRPLCAAPDLHLEEGKTGDFAEVRVKCACGAERNVSNALVPQLNPTCGGERPWLGGEGREPCDEQLRLLVRTASNSYFAQVVSALSIPEPGMTLRDAIKDNWGTLQVATAENLPPFRQIPKIGKALIGQSDEDVLRTIEDIRKGREPAREPLRTAEFKQFVSAPLEKTGDLPPPKGVDREFFARHVPVAERLKSKIARVVLAHRLREVRVQLGFTRIEAPAPNLQGEYDLGVTTAPLGLQTDWLPASEVRGEGIFIQLDENAVQAWERRPAVQARGKQLLKGFDAWNGERATPLPFPGMRYYMLHSLAHLLGSALALECGYSASAISERIYCAPAGDPTPMAAILISTGSPGTEGTLGGLVEQGRYLTEHLRRAFELGTLCSNDPVCAAHSPENDLAERYLEGAACHGCLFVAECSCERFNHFLDRALVVPTMGRTGVAFFEQAP